MERKTVTEYESEAVHAVQVGDYKRAAELFDAAAGVSLGARRSAWYAARADECLARVN
jgi:hypothetical protein